MGLYALLKEVVLDVNVLDLVMEQGVLREVYGVVVARDHDGFIWFVTNCV